MMNLSVYPHECDLLTDDYSFYILKISMQRSQTQGLQTNIQK